MLYKGVGSCLIASVREVLTVPLIVRGKSVGPLDPYEGFYLGRCGVAEAGHLPGRRMMR